MSLNVKNRDAHRLARELAELTGESMTEAVTEALRQRPEREREARRPDLADELLAIGRDCAARLAEPYASSDHAALLYDENGLPA